MKAGLVPPATARVSPRSSRGSDRRRRGHSCLRSGRLSLTRALVLGLGFLSLVVALAAAAAPARSALPIPAETKLLEEMAAKGTNADRLYALGDVCHDAGVTGDKKAVERAEGYLRQLLALEPTNAPALALLGSVYTMKGRDAFWPNVQLRLVHEGNDYMDQAVRLDSNSLRVRLTRAFNNAHMPDFLGRTEIVRHDLAWLWERAEKEPERFTISQRQELALHWGRQLKRQHLDDQARQVWTRGRSLAPDSKFGTELAAELARIR